MTPSMPHISTSDGASHDEVLADIAHGLQAPLAAINAHLSLIQKKHPRTKQLRICSHLAEDMSHMVRDLVRLARTDTAVRECVQEKIDMGALVASTIEYMGVLAQSKGIELSASIEPDVHVRGARKQLEETIANFITNSIKYVDASIPDRNRIDVRVSSTDASCVIEIADTGCGIDADELPYVFSRFYRTRAGTARAPGSGLGLAIAKKTIEAHRGSIVIQSEPGKGTLVTCTIPLHEPKLPLAQCAQTSIPAFVPPHRQEGLLRAIRDTFRLRS